MASELQKADTWNSRVIHTVAQSITGMIERSNWSSLQAMMTPDRTLPWQGRSLILVLLVSILVLYTGITTALGRSKKHFAKLERAKEFGIFTAEHHCARTTKSIPYGFVPSIRHKINLLWNLSGDLLAATTGKDFKRYGDTHALYDSYGLTKGVHTINPTNVHAVLSTRSADYGVPAARLAAIGPVGSKGVVMTEGDLWLQNRKAINRGFRGARTTQGIEHNIQILFDSVTFPSENPDGWSVPVPLFDAFAMMSLDRSIKHMFGVQENIQGTSEGFSKHALQWKESFDTMAEFVSIRSVLGKMSWLWDGPAFRKSCTTLRDLCENTVKTAVHRARQGVPSNEASFVGNLVHETSDVRRVVDITLDVFIAGHNMTAGVLCWLFFELEKRPDVYEDVRNQVRGKQKQNYTLI